MNGYGAPGTYPSSPTQQQFQQPHFQQQDREEEEEQQQQEQGPMGLVVQAPPQGSPLHNDAIALLQLAYALGKNEDWLKNGNGDDVSRWVGVAVRGGRVVMLDWHGQVSLSLAW